MTCSSICQVPAAHHFLVLPSHMAPAGCGHQQLIGVDSNGCQALPVSTPPIQDTCPQPPGPLPEGALLITWPSATFLTKCGMTAHGCTYKLYCPLQVHPEVMDTLQTVGVSSRVYNCHHRLLWPGRTSPILLLFRSRARNGRSTAISGSGCLGWRGERNKFY